MNMLFGIPVFENKFLTVPNHEYVQRSWKERLFSWPWRPWKKKKLVITYLPDPKIYLIDGKIFAHPVTAANLRGALSDVKEVGKV